MRKPSPPHLGRGIKVRSLGRETHTEFVKENNPAMAEEQNRKAEIASTFEDIAYLNLAATKANKSKSGTGPKADSHATPKAIVSAKRRSARRKAKDGASIFGDPESLAPSNGDPRTGEAIEAEVLSRIDVKGRAKPLAGRTTQPS